MQKGNFQKKLEQNYPTIDRCCEQGEDQEEKLQINKIMKNIKMKIMKMIIIIEIIKKITKNKKEMKEMRKTKTMKEEIKITEMKDKRIQGKMGNK